MVRPVVPLVAAVASAVAVLTACAEPEIVLSWEATVERVADGDSLVLKGGDRVRLLQIDAPELGEGECYGREALRALDQLLQPGDRVLLETDPGLDGADRHGRLLRYVHSGNTNVNVELVRRGAATAFFLGGDQGRHAKPLLAATEDARNDRRGMWGTCSVTWNPRRQVETRYG